MVLLRGWLVRGITLFLSELFEYLLNTLSKALFDSIWTLFYSSCHKLSSCFLSLQEDIELKDSIIQEELKIPPESENKLSREARHLVKVML